MLKCGWSYILCHIFSQLLEQEILNNRKRLQMEALAAKQVSRKSAEFWFEDFDWYSQNFMIDYKQHDFKIC